MAWQLSKLICFGNQLCTPTSQRERDRERAREKERERLRKDFRENAFCHTNLYFFFLHKRMRFGQLHKCLFWIKKKENPFSAYLWPLIAFLDKGGPDFLLAYLWRHLVWSRSYLYMDCSSPVITIPKLFLGSPRPWSTNGIGCATLSLCLLL